MKPCRYFIRIFMIVYNLMVICLTFLLLEIAASLKRSTPFVNDVLVAKMPFKSDKVQSIVVFQLLFLLTIPMNLIGCGVACVSPLYQTRLITSSLSGFQLLLGIGLFFTDHQVENRFEIELEMIESIMQYNTQFNKDDADKWDVTHYSLKCCGYDNYRDWFITPNGNRTYVPDSCCKSPENYECGADASSNPSVEETIHSRGCYPIIRRQLKFIQIVYHIIACILVSMPIFTFVMYIRSRMKAKRRQQD